MVYIRGAVEGTDICRRCKNEISDIEKFLYEADTVSAALAVQGYRMETERTGIFFKEIFIYVNLRCQGKLLFKRDHDGHLINARVVCYD